MEAKPQREFKSLSWHGLGLLLVSAAVLCFEVNLTRLFSVSQFYHFAFMVVSIAVLGFGASGTYLALRKVKPCKQEMLLLPWLAAGAGISMLGSTIFVNLIPFDSFRIALEPSQDLLLLLHYAVLSVPFFFSGMIISLLLRQHRSAGGKVYALNLLGSALGCLAAVLLPGLVDGEGVVLASTVLALLGGLFFMREQKGRGSAAPESKGVGSNLILWGGFLLATGLMVFRLVLGHYPDLIELKLSPYKGLSYALQPPDAQVVSSHWNSFSRVDVVSSPSLHALPGLSYRYSGPLPSIKGLFVDGDHLSPILQEKSSMAFAAHLPQAVAYQLRPTATALILDSKTGMDAQVGLSLGAVMVTAIEDNPLIVEASQAAYEHAMLTLSHSSGRSFLRGKHQMFDVVQIPLTDSYHPVSSGAYALGEDFRYTIEAFEDALLALKPDGILVVSRWLQEEPTEWLRTFILASSALQRQGLDPQSRIVALRGYNTGTLLVKLTPFQEDEMVNIRQFANERAFDLAFGPDIHEEELNQFNILPEPVYYKAFHDYLTSDPPEAFFRNYAFDVRPPTDDHPYFGHYFKWSQLPEILADFGVTWQPFGGAGYLVIIIILGLALLLSGGLILLPLAGLKKSNMSIKNKTAPVYFGLIGLGFMLVEVPLIQKFILYLDQPAYAFTAVLFCILLFSGLGSRFGARKIPLPLALLVLFGWLFLDIFLLSPMISASLGFPLGARLVLSIVMIAPLGFLMGIPFPAGLAWGRTGGGEREVRWWVAWVWAVNGAASVVAAILASLLALSLGFTVTFAIGTVFYGLAGMVAWRSRKAVDTG